MMQTLRMSYKVTLMALLWSIQVKSQNHIDGTYDQKYRTFIPHVNLLNNGFNPKYRVDDLVHGYGAIENNDAKLKGVIDSTGKVCIPLVYESLESCNQRGYFIFHREGKTGLVTVTGIEMCVIKSEGRRDDKNKVIASKVIHIFYLYMYGKVGVFDAWRNRIVVPAIYDQSNFLNHRLEVSRRKHATIYLNDSIGIVKKADSLFVHGLDEVQRSAPYQDIVLLSNGLFFLKSFDGFVGVCSDYMKPVNTLDFRVLDTYNDYVLGRKSTGYGITTADGKIAIPFEYEDIYFANKNSVWLKRGGLWALASYQHQLFSKFEFEDIDQTNDWFIHQLLEVTRLDTTGGNLLIERDYPGINDAPTDLKILIYQVEQLRTTKRTYNTVLDFLGGTNRAAAKRADGWHFVYPPLGTIEPEAWEAVHYVPNCIDPYGMMAYQLKGKWGVEKDEIRYERVIYDSMDLTINCTCECIVKKGYIYSNSTNYSGSTVKPCNWEKQMKWEEYTVR